MSGTYPNAFAKLVVLQREDLCIAARRLDDLVAAAQCNRKWLFAEHVKAGIETGSRDNMVCPRLGWRVDPLNLRHVTGHLGQVSKYAWSLPKQL